MRIVSLEELLEAGCHFGHQVQRQNPKAREYIFEARDGIHIIDLEKTKEGLEETGRFIKDISKKDGGTLLIVATKRQAEPIIREALFKLQEAGVAGIYVIYKRWIGGTLTNFQEVSKNFKKLKELTEKLSSETEKARFTKREISEWEKERLKLEGFYGGIKDMVRLPDALFVIDTHLERVAVDEAKKMKIQTSGLTDTNSDPTLVDFPIPANDDAVGSIKLITDYILEAWVEGKRVETEETKAETKVVVKEQKEITDTEKPKKKQATKKVVKDEK